MLGNRRACNGRKRALESRSFDSMIYLVAFGQSRHRAWIRGRWTLLEEGGGGRRGRREEGQGWRKGRPLGGSLEALRLPFWGRFSVSGGLSWASWGPLGPSLGPLGGLLGASWGPLGASWVPLGTPPSLIDVIQNGPRRRHGGPGSPKRAPRAARERPKRGNTNRKIELSAPRGPQEAPRDPQGAPRGPQEAQKRPQNSPPEASKLPPGGPREASHEIPTNIQEASEPQPRHGGGMGRPTATRHSAGYKSASWVPPLWCRREYTT